MDYRARWYDPRLGRFIQADTVVPQRNDPQNHNRYAYARNNPLVYTDESGHCWGIASGLRNVPGYGVTCSNLDMALAIVQHPDASLGQKAGAAAYIATEGAAHLALVAGGGMLAWEGGVAVAAAAGGTEAASTAITAACADGDCTNEIRTASNAFCADGDCTNEITAAEQAGLEVFERAQEFGIRPYNGKLTQGTGLQVHHIVERRFADVGTLEIAPKRMLSVILTPEEHQAFTNAWRNLIGYSNSVNPLKTTTAGIEDIWHAAQEVYQEYPILLEAARRTIFGE